MREEHPISNGPALTNHGSGDCPGGNHDGTSFEGRQSWSAKFGEDEAEEEQTFEENID